MIPANTSLHEIEWDAVVIGNGVTALWTAHQLWRTKNSVLWISSEDPCSAERALLTRGWHWGFNHETAHLLSKDILGLDDKPNLFELAYFDARSTKRFRRFEEVKKEWGAHEKEYFQTLEKDHPYLLDLWHWHSKLHAFYNNDLGTQPACVELFSEPRFIRVQAWPVLELKVKENRVCSAVLSGFKKAIEVSGKQFYLGDYSESLPLLIQDNASATLLASALKGRKYYSGFGIRIWHKNDAQIEPISHTMIIPLVANPSEKQAHSHTIGRFIEKSGMKESYWMGFLSDEETEDNNEILKKIKLTKRAIDRAMPGFLSSLEKEAISFEPRMWAQELVKNHSIPVLGAILLSDYGSYYSYEPNASLQAAHQS